jgi:hypothetical protein
MRGLLGRHFRRDRSILPEVGALPLGFLSLSLIAGHIGSPRPFHP